LIVEEASELPAASPTVPTPHRPASARRRILIVDDNGDAAESLAELLALLGHETSTAHDGVAAIEMAERLRPSVVLLDIGLPGMSGHDVARAIRHETWGADMLLIALTGWGQTEDRTRSRRAGFDHHLVKPLDLSQLEELISSVPVA
jgi:CheY-like chemotaxis protein